MGLFRRRKSALARALDIWYPGIILRVSTVNGEVLRVTSDELYHKARYERLAQRPPRDCDPSCPPGCDRHGWLSLVGGLASEFTGPPMPGEEFSTVPLKIEIKPMRLGRHQDLAAAADA